MESGRFLSIEIVNTTIQQYIDNYDWSAIIAAALATHNASAVAHAAAIAVHDADPTAHPTLGVVPCLYLSAESLSVPLSVVTDVPWDTELLDTEDFWDAGDPTHINIPAAKKGLYLASIYLSFDATTYANTYERVILSGGNDPIYHTWRTPYNAVGSQNVAAHWLISAATAGVCSVEQGVDDTLTLGYIEIVLARLKAI